MIYSFETYVANCQDNPKDFGTNSREQFDSWSGLEKYEFESALGGTENMANFSYSAGTQNLESDENDPQKILIDEVCNVIEIALRDTAVKAYREAFDNGSIKSD